MKTKFSGLVHVLVALAILLSLIVISGTSASATAQITLFPSSSGVAGNSITVQATNFSAGTQLNARFDGVLLATSPMTVIVPPSGVIYFTVLIPLTTPGVHTISVTDGVNIASQNFNVLPQPKIYIGFPACGTPGTTVTVYGYGFAGGVMVRLDIDGVQGVGWTQTDVNGSFTGTFIVPSGLTPGAYTVSALDGAGYSATSTFTVNPIGTYILVVHHCGDDTSLVTEPGEGFFIYPAGTVVNLVATPDYGSEFISWLGAVADPYSPTTYIVMTYNATVYAGFTFFNNAPPCTPIPGSGGCGGGGSGGWPVVRSLTMEVNGCGDVTPGVGTRYIPYRGPSDMPLVGISATPCAGWQFAGWTGDVADTNSPTTTVTMNSNKVVAANFNPAPPYAPNPNGYNFVNDNVLMDNPHTAVNEGLSEASKWDIFTSTFDLSGVDQTTIDRWFSATNFGTGGNCYGMSASSLMEYIYPQHDQFLENQAKKYVHELAQPQIGQWYWSNSEQDNGWDASGDINEKSILKHIVGFQIAQMGIPASSIITGTENVLNTMRNEFPQQMYILAIFDAGSGHALVPFRLETITPDQEYRLFVYDSNHPDDEARFVTIKKSWFGLGNWCWEYDLGWVTWSGPSWWGINGDDTIELIPISVAYNGGHGLRLPGTSTAQGAMVFMLGRANLLLTDPEGRLAGFNGNSFVEDIPSVKLVFPLGILPNEEPKEWQPTFYLSTDTHVSYRIEGASNGNEQCTLLKFGKGYLVEFTGAIGQQPTIVNISDDGTSISIHGQENEYGLVLNRNMDGGSQTFTAANISSTCQAIHQYTINWDSLSQDQKGVTLQIDSNGDGIFEQTINSDATLQPPVAEAGLPYSGNEGSPIDFNASGSNDPDGTIAQYEWDFGDGFTATGISPTHAYGDNRVYTVTLTVTDDDGLTSIDTTEVTVSNVPPTIHTIIAPTDPVAVNKPLNAWGNFTDPGWLDTHTAEWDWGDGSISDGFVTESNGSGNVTSSHTYNCPGVYTITLSVIDDDGDVGTATATVTVTPQPFKAFVIKNLAIQWAPHTPKWQGSDSFSIFGRLQLPQGYTWASMQNQATITISIGGKSGNDTVVLKAKLYGRPQSTLWSYRGSEQPPGYGMNINNMVIWSAPQGTNWNSWAGFYIGGVLQLPEPIGINTLPANVKVTLEIPLMTTAGCGSLMGEQTVPCKVYKPLNLWTYNVWPNLPTFPYDATGKE